MESEKEPFEAGYRNMINTSDSEYAKVLQSYFNKERDAKQLAHARKNNITLSKLRAYINGEVSNYGFRRRLPSQEKVFIQHLSDVDMYDTQHMAEALTNIDRGVLRNDKSL